MILVTSNKFKQKEFSRFGLSLEIQKGLDLKEVEGTPEEVVIYKALEAGEGFVVEDTILVVDGVEIVDIREKINDLEQYRFKSAIWKVSIACLLEGVISIASAEVQGCIGFPNVDLNNSFGFDPMFYVETEKGLESLSKLDEKGLKDSFSARKKCIENFLTKSNDYKTIKKEDVPEWKGEYQKISH